MERLAFTNSNRIFKQLEERVSYAALRGEDKDIYDADLKAYRDIMGQLEYALDKGWKKGMAEGILQGKAEGILQGKAEGILQGKAEGILQGKAEGEETMLRKSIRIMLGLGISPEKIAEQYRLSLADVQRLMS